MLENTGKFRTLGDQRALPDAQQQFLELMEIPRTEFSAPLSLDVLQDIDDLGINSVPTPGKPHHSRPTLFWGIGPGEITELLEGSEQTVHGLLAHTGAFRERAGTNSIGSG